MGGGRALHAHVWEDRKQLRVPCAPSVLVQIPGALGDTVFFLASSATSYKVASPAQSRVHPFLLPS